MSTKIEWTNETWNPIIGCTKISEGCKECYAEKFAYRLRNIAFSLEGKMNYKSENPKPIEYYPDVVNQWGDWTGKTFLIEESLNKPFRWKKQRMIFVCSMGDLFHEMVDFKWIDEIMEIIAMNPQHIFQVLTKRPENMKRYFDSERGWMNVAKEYPLPNLWLGVTAENQEKAEDRIPILLKIPAKVRFASCEPLLEEILLLGSFHNYLEGWDTEMRSQGSEPIETEIKTNELNWVIAGPETGPRKRECKKGWIESLYDQCKAANVPFFDKKDILGKNIKQMPI